jgi:undecaprenyl diphosphate synthase
MNELNHVAIIMDGNGRWGLKKKNSRNFGHLKGLETVEIAIRASIKKKIKFLTLYTFSTDNWKRPKKEVNFLFKLIRKSIKKNLKKVIRQGIKVNIIGKKKGLPKNIMNTIQLIEKKTFYNKKITLNLALNYGSKEEIINACKTLSKTNEKEINVNNFEKELYTRDMPDPEILIRTGGAKRLSNFLLWQLAYTEIFFVDKLWPDFNEKDFNKILNKFYNIERKFGKIND